MMRPRCDCGGIPVLDYSWTREGLVLRRMVCDGCGKVTECTQFTSSQERFWMILCGANAPPMRPGN